MIETIWRRLSIGVELGDIVGLHSRMDAAIKGYPYAKAAVEFAVYDLTGRWLNVPVHMLLGGSARPPHPGHAFDRTHSDCRSRGGGGKGRGRGNTGRSRSRLVLMPNAMSRSSRRSEPPSVTRVELCVDANEGYRTPGEAISPIRQMEPYQD